jgi:hypothetical protein
MRYSGSGVCADDGDRRASTGSDYIRILVRTISIRPWRNLLCVGLCNRWQGRGVAPFWQRHRLTLKPSSPAVRNLWGFFRECGPVRAMGGERPQPTKATLSAIQGRRHLGHRSLWKWLPPVRQEGRRALVARNSYARRLQPARITSAKRGREGQSWAKCSSPYRRRADRRWASPV